MAQVLSRCAGRGLALSEALQGPYSPKCLEGVFSEVRLLRILRTSEML
jgi:hypothetical protein